MKDEIRFSAEGFKTDARVDARMAQLYLAAGLPVPARLLPARIPGQDRYELETRRSDG